METNSYSEKPELGEMTIGDKMLIVLVVILSIYSLFYIKTTATSTLEKNVIVRYDGIEIAKIQLKTDNQSRTYDFEFGENVGTLEMQAGSVRMLPMNKDICPEGICSDIGWIKNSYDSIVCLPNRIIVTIESDDTQDIDIIAINAIEGGTDFDKNRSM